MIIFIFSVVFFQLLNYSTIFPIFSLSTLLTIHGHWVWILEDAFLFYILPWVYHLSLISLKTLSPSPTMSFVCPFYPFTLLRTDRFCTWCCVRLCLLYTLMNASLFLQSSVLYPKLLFIYLFLILRSIVASTVKKVTFPSLLFNPTLV